MDICDTKISIIVPVYNIIEFLPRCLDSIVNQSLKDIEIILIDDGSDDGSEKICDEYANKDNRIKVIHQKNAGLSIARNVGINHSNGKYILFVDSDDYIKLDSCEKLYEKAIRNDGDIVAADIIVSYAEKEYGLNRKMNTNHIYLGEKFIIDSIKIKSMWAPVQFALYKRKLIVENKHYFKPGILHEDELWTPQIYLFAKKVVYLHYNFYYYWQREGSITHQKNREKNCRDLITTCNELYEKYKNLNKDSKKYLNDYLCTNYLYAIYIGKEINANRIFAFKIAGTIRNKIKALIYFFSPRLFLKLHKIFNDV